MGLLSIFQRRNGDAGPGSAGALPDDDVAAARTRARRRLLGAAVLVMVGVIAFPLVFETQPRPIPVDIPIDIPRKDGSPGLAMPPLRTTAPKASAVAARPREEPITETAAEAGREVAPAPAPQAAASVATPKKSAAVAAAARPAASAGDGGRARALLEGKEPATAKTAEAAHEAGRFVVQVGAFADEAAARETRTKIDKLGLKSYTQVVETASGSRIRVRAGPFSSRDEADKAMAKARAAGLSAVVLTL